MRRAFHGTNHTDSPGHKEASAESMSSSKIGGDAIVEVLGLYDIEFLFTSPIAALAPLWEAFAKKEKEFPNTGTKYVNCRHETTAVGAAIGYYKSTGRMAAVCLPTGLGTLNGSMAIRTALQEKIPMLIISPDTLTFGEDTSKCPGPEWPCFLIDSTGPAKHAATTTKWNISCRTNYDLYPNLHRAIYFAQQIPRGPTMVEIPFDLMMADFQEVDNRFPVPLVSDSTISSSVHISNVSSIIGEARNPVVITEHFGRDRNAKDILQRFAELIAAPVFEWWMPAYKNIDRHHPLHGKGYVEEVLHDADVIIVAGSNGPWHGPNQKLKDGVKIILLEQDPMRPHSAFWGYATTHCVSGDPAMNLSAICSHLETNNLIDPTESATRLAKWTAYNGDKARGFESATSGDAAKAQEDGTRLHASTVFRKLSDALPSGAIIVDEMVAQVPYFTHFLFQDPQKDFVHLRGWQGGLGTGLSVALGAKMAHPDTPVVCIIGDGAFSYNPTNACFGLAQQYKAPVLVVVMNNEGYVSQTWNFYKYFEKGTALAEQNTLGNVIDPRPDYQHLPRAFGGNGSRVMTEAEFEDAIRLALAGGNNANLSLLDVSVTP